MPSNVQLLDINDRKVPFTTSGNSSSGEDLDFIIEENKTIKEMDIESDSN